MLRLNHYQLKSVKNEIVLAYYSKIKKKARTVQLNQNYMKSACLNSLFPRIALGNVTALLESGLNVNHISLLRAGGVSFRAKFPRDYAAISRLLNYTARFAERRRESTLVRRESSRDRERATWNVGRVRGVARHN